MLSATETYSFTTDAKRAFLLHLSPMIIAQSHLNRNVARLEFRLKSAYPAREPLHALLPEIEGSVLNT